MTHDDYDEMSLGDLLDLANERGVPGYHPFTGWLEDHYDPAKSALIDLLNWHEGLDTESQVR